MPRGKHSKPKLNFEKPLEVGGSQKIEDDIRRRDLEFSQSIPGPEDDYDGLRYYNGSKLGSWKDLQEVIRQQDLEKSRRRKNYISSCPEKNIPSDLEGKLDDNFEIKSLHPDIPHQKKSNGEYIPSPKGKLLEFKKLRFPKDQVDTNITKEQLIIHLNKLLKKEYNKV